jgi:hypothetical protein
LILYFSIQQGFFMQSEVDDPRKGIEHGEDIRLLLLLAALALAGTPMWFGVFLVLRWTVSTAWAAVVS